MRLRVLKAVAIGVGGIVLAGAMAFAIDAIFGVLVPRPDYMVNGSVAAGPPASDNQISLHDFAITCSINAMGLRDHEIAPGKSDRVRIVAIGDSYTFGWGVELENSWVKQLGRRLREAGLDVEIINAGEPGAGPLEYWQMAEFLVPRLKPDLVLVEVLQCDDLMQAEFNFTALALPNVWGWLRWRNSTWRPSATPPSTRVQQSFQMHTDWMMSSAKDHLAHLGPEARARYDALDSEIKDLFLKGKLNPWMIASAVQTGDQFIDATHENDMKMRLLSWMLGVMLGRIRRIAEREGGQVVALSIPNGVYDNRHVIRRLRRLGHPIDDSVLFSEVPDKLARRAADQAGVPFCEVSQVFRERADDPTLYFEMDHHFAAPGYALFAKSIAPFIEGCVRKQMNGRAVSSASPPPLAN